MSEKDGVRAGIKDLKIQLLDSQDALQNLIFQKSMQQLEDLSQLKKTRKRIAKIKTLIHEAMSSKKI